MCSFRCWIKFSQYVLILLALLVCPSHIYAQSKSDTCPSLDRPDYIVNYLKNVQIVGRILQGTGYAGDVENPRPVPPLSLSDVKNDRQKTWSTLNNTIIFAFSPKHITHKSNDIIPINKWEFWCLVRAGDDVLLSDRITHHYTTIHMVDRENNVVFIQDPWPDRIFLREGFNQANVAAKVRNGIVSITKEEYLRVIIGLLTPDTPALIEHYLTNNNDSKTNPKKMFAFASTLLEHGFPEYIHGSLEYFRNTLALLDPEKEQTLYYRTAQRLAFALAKSSYLHYQDGNVKKANLNSHELNNLFSKIDLNKIGPLYSTDDFYALANLVGTVGDYNKAIHYYTEAIRVDSNFYAAYLYRALAKQRVGDHSGSVSDATKALQRIDKKINSINDLLTKEKNLGWGQGGKMLSEKDHLIRQKVKSLTIRSDSYLALDKTEESTADSRAVRRLQGEP